MQMSFPSRATMISPSFTDCTSDAPLFESRQLVRPFIISMVSLESETLSGDAGATGSPGAIENGPARSALAAIACPDHFSDPSGQYASGQLCTATCLPFVSVRRKCASFTTAPRGQG